MPALCRLLRAGNLLPPPKLGLLDEAPGVGIAVPTSLVRLAYELLRGVALDMSMLLFSSSSSNVPSQPAPRLLKLECARTRSVLAFGA